MKRERRKKQNGVERVSIKKKIKFVFLFFHNAVLVESRVCGTAGTKQIHNL